MDVTFTAKKNELYAHIKAVGVFWGEPIESLRIYAKEIVNDWSHDLDTAIACFVELKKQTESSS